MTISASITVTRSDEDIEVELRGSLERYGSMNPHERGLGLGDWDVVSPIGLVLTIEESNRAIEALERSI